MNIKSNSKILILGTGGNALAFAEHARNMGHSSLVVGSNKRSELFESIGVKAVISYEESDVVAAIKGAGFGLVDVIIDAVGSKDNLKKLLPILDQGGKVGTYGLNERKNDSIKDKKTIDGKIYFDGTIYDEGSAHDEVVERIESGKLNAWNYLSKKHIYPIEDIEKALFACANREVIKSVITFN